MQSLLDRPRLTVSSAARRLGMHPNTIRRWLLSGVRGRVLPATMLGGRLMIDVAALEEFVAGGQIVPEGEHTDPRFDVQAANDQQLAAARLGG